jgi:outer membrane biosynthesis protein TonB
MSLEDHIAKLTAAIVEANTINREALDLRKQMFAAGKPEKLERKTALELVNTPAEEPAETPPPAAEKPKGKAPKKETAAPEPAPEPVAEETPEPVEEEAPAEEPTPPAAEPEVEVTLEMVRELVRPLLAACKDEAEKAAVNAKTGAALAEFGKTKFTELDPSDRAAFYKRMKEVHS